MVPFYPAVCIITPHLYDLNSVLQFRNKKIKITEVLKQVSEHTKHNVIFDGVITPYDLMLDGSYKISDLLDIVCKDSGNRWKIDSGNIYVFRDFEKRLDFPDISLAEIKATSERLVSYIKISYDFPEKPTTVSGMIQNTVSKLSPQQQKMLDSSEGIPINILSKEQQNQIGNAMYYRQLGSVLSHWNSLKLLVGNLDACKLSVVKFEDVDLLEIKSEKLSMRIQLYPSQEKLSESEGVYKKLKDNEEMVLMKFVDAPNVGVSPSIQNHFLYPISITNKVNFLKGVASHNNWKFSFNEESKKYLLEPASKLAGMVGSFPREYRQYFEGGNAKGLSEIGYGAYFSDKVDRLDVEMQILSNICLKNITNSKPIEPGKLNGIDRYFIARLLLNYTLRQTIKEIMSAEKAPDVFLTDYKNSILIRKMNGSMFTIIHPQGTSLTMRVRRFPVSSGNDR